MSQEINPELLKFIKECLEKGFEHYEIKTPLIERGWPLDQIEKAFEEIKQQENKKIKKKIIKDNKTSYIYKNSITIHLDDEIMKIIERRAKKNMLTIQEQIEDIIRRSCVNTKKKTQEVEDNVDDLFLKLFSRKNSGRPRKQR